MGTEKNSKQSKGPQLKDDIPGLFGKRGRDLYAAAIRAATPEGGESIRYKTSLGKGQSFSQRTHDRFDKGTSSVKVYKGDGVKYKSKSVFDEAGNLVKDTVKIKQRAGKTKKTTPHR